jgi:hypothetical protein
MWALMPMLRILAMSVLMENCLSKNHACRDVRGVAGEGPTGVPKSNSRNLIIAEIPAGLKSFAEPLADVPWAKRKDGQRTGMK